MKILLYGAGGVQNTPLAQQLAQAGHTVRVLARSPQKFAGTPYEIIEGDAFNRADCERATSGVDAVSLHQPLSGTSAERLGGVEHAVAAAKQAGVSRLVFNVGVRTPDEQTTSREFELKRQSEGLVRQSGLNFALVRPPLYLDNLLQPQFLDGIRAGTFAYPLPADYSVAWIGARGVAACMLAALESAGNRVYEVGGPQALSGTAMAHEISEALNREVRFQSVPLESLEAALNAAYGAPAGTDIADTYRVTVAQPNFLSKTGSDGLGVEIPSAREWLQQNLLPLL